jgi:D-3-phosphoglycerate dehydrogenase
MIKVLANDGIHPDGKMLLEEGDIFVDTNKVPQEELHKVLPDYDVIIVRSATKVRKDLIDACPNLKVIARGGVGIDNIDAEYARSKGIKVVNTPAASSQAVAELAFAHMFTLLRHLHKTNREMPVNGVSDFKTLKKNYETGVQLRGLTLGVVGFGRIGQAVARMGLGLGMQVLPYDPIVKECSIPITIYNHDDLQFHVKLKTVEFDTLLKKSDIITLHVPAVGKALVGAEEFAKMKDGSYIVNTARGGVIDENALLEALNSGKLAGAGLDVFENEPTPMAALLQHPNISLTPHTGASTVQAQRYIGLELAEKILEHFGLSTSTFSHQS